MQIGRDGVKLCLALRNEQLVQSSFSCDSAAKMDENIESYPQVCINIVGKLYHFFPYEHLFVTCQSFQYN